MSVKGHWGHLDKEGKNIVQHQSGTWIPHSQKLPCTWRHLALCSLILKGLSVRANLQLVQIWQYVCTVHYIAVKGVQVVATLFNNTCNLEVIRCDKNFNNVFIVDSKISTVHGNYRGRSSTQLMKCFHLWGRQLPGSTPSCHEQTWRGSSKHYVMSWEYFLPHFLTEPSEEFRNEQPFLDRYQILKGKAVDSERMIVFALLFVPFFTSWSRGHDTLWKMY